LNNFIS